MVPAGSTLCCISPAGFASAKVSTCCYAWYAILRTADNLPPSSWFTFLGLQGGHWRSLHHCHTAYRSSGIPWRRQTRTLLYQPIGKTFFCILLMFSCLPIFWLINWCTWSCNHSLFRAAIKVLDSHVCVHLWQYLYCKSTVRLWE